MSSNPEKTHNITDFLEAGSLFFKPQGSYDPRQFIKPTCSPDGVATLKIMLIGDHQECLKWAYRAIDNLSPSCVPSRLYKNTVMLDSLFIEFELCRKIHHVATTFDSFDPDVIFIINNHEKGIDENSFKKDVKYILENRNKADNAKNSAFIRTINTSKADNAKSDIIKDIANKINSDSRFKGGFNNKIDSPNVGSQAELHKFLTALYTNGIYTDNPNVGSQTELHTNEINNHSRFEGLRTISF